MGPSPVLAAAVAALGIPGALAAVVIAIVAFAVVLGVCFVVLRLITFVVSGSDEEGAERDEPEGEAPQDHAESEAP